MKKHLIQFSIEDWSHYGHGLQDTFTIESNKSNASVL